MRRGALTAGGLAAAIVPALVAVAAGLAAALALRHQAGAVDTLVVRLTADAIAFSAVYFATLRVAFAQPLAELLEVAPGGARLGYVLGLHR
jgi:hypothetical protein